MTHYHINVCLPADACPLYVHEIVADRLAPWQAATQTAARCYLPLTPWRFVALPLDLPSRFLSADETALEWGPLVAAYNMRCFDGRSLPEPPVRLDEQGQPYQRYADIHTMISDGRLPDWFYLGGIFSGLPLRPEAARTPLAHRVRGWVGAFAGEIELIDGTAARIGAPIGLIDFDQHRQQHTAWAANVIGIWAAITANLPEPKPWSVFLRRHHDDPDGYPRIRARAEFHNQPAVLAMAAHDAQARTAHGPKPLQLGTDIGYASLIEQMALGADTFINWYRDRALLGDALLTLDGQFLTAHTNPAAGPAPLTDQVAVARRTREYLDGVPEDTILVTAELFIWPPTANAAAGPASALSAPPSGHHQPHAA